MYKRQILTSMVVDVSDLLDQARQRGDFVMFEGAQGTLLDIDHGTYPVSYTHLALRSCSSIMP